MKIFPIGYFPFGYSLSAAPYSEIALGLPPGNMPGAMPEESAAVSKVPEAAPANDFTAALVQPDSTCIRLPSKIAYFTRTKHI